MKPCATCGEQHVYGRDGWYAGEGKDRHPYKPAEPQAAPGELDKRYRRTNIVTALIVECIDCWPPFPVLNQRVSIADHDAFHAGRER